MKKKTTKTTENEDSDTAQTIRNIIHNIIEKDKGIINSEFAQFLSQKLPQYYLLDDFYRLDFKSFQNNIVSQAIFTVDEAIHFLQYVDKKYKNEFDDERKQTPSFKMIPFVHLENADPSAAAAVLGSIKGVHLFEHLSQLSSSSNDVERDYDYELKEKDHEIKKLKSMNTNPALMNNDLFEACTKGNMEFLKKYFSENPEDINLTAFNGCTPLHYAVLYKHYKLMDYLLQRKAKLDIKSTRLFYSDKYPSKKVTPLHIAVFKDDLEAAKKLMNYGAPQNIQDENGKTPVEYASPEMLKILNSNE